MGVSDEESDDAAQKPQRPSPRTAAATIAAADEDFGHGSDGEAASDSEPSENDEDSPEARVKREATHHSQPHVHGPGGASLKRGVDFYTKEGEADDEDEAAVARSASSSQALGGSRKG